MQLGQGAAPLDKARAINTAAGDAARAGIRDIKVVRSPPVVFTSASLVGMLAHYRKVSSMKHALDYMLQSNLRGAL